ncbi:MAG: hypothetical protein HQL69_19775 [Magnetococcales bacterium]|nr:hypothetical protein [Magnetococcales bacterium]
MPTDKEIIVTCPNCNDEYGFTYPVPRGEFECVKCDSVFIVRKYKKKEYSAYLVEEEKKSVLVDCCHCSEQLEIELPISNPTYECQECNNMFSVNKLLDGGYSTTSTDQDITNNDIIIETTKHQNHQETNYINSNQGQYSLTWLATVVCIFLVIPGTVIGGVVKTIYHAVFSAIISVARQSWYPDFIQSIFNVIDSIALQYFPSLLHGIIGGAFAIIVTRKLFKHSNYEAVYFATAFSWAVLGIFIWTSLTTMKGIPNDSISFVAQIIGTTVGLQNFHKSDNN